MPIDKRFAINFSVHVDNPDTWNRLWVELSERAGALGKYNPMVSLTSHDLSVDFDPNEEESNEYHDENTLFLVMEALGRAGLGHMMVQDAIREMQNAGILFRQRR